MAKKKKSSRKKTKTSYHDHVDQYLGKVQKIAEVIDRDAINDMINILADVRDNEGRLFVLGVGGSAANASHMVNDFRKIGHIETYTPIAIS